MPDSENIALIQKMYSAFSAGDIQTILQNVSTAAEWVCYGPAVVPYSGSFTGRIADFFQAIAESTTGGRVIPGKFVASGDTVVALGRYLATVRRTSANIDTPVAHIFTVRDGKVTSWIGFSDTAAVAAAHMGTAASAGG